MAFKYVLIAVVTVFCVEALSALTLTKRALSSNASANTSTEEVEICQGSTPCGWAVYNKLTRYLDYFLRNKCECSKEKRCLREEDDISITAYVYRCKIADPPKSNS